MIYNLVCSKSIMEDRLDMQDSLQFAKQFLITSTSLDNPLIFNWTVSKIMGGYHFYTHPKLNVTRTHNPENEFIGLGIFLDPRCIPADDRQIIQRLCETCQNFGELEAALAGLGGRWALIASINGESRIYHDATGQKSVFFHTSESNEKYICSQPSLLDALQITPKNRELVQEFEKFPNPGSWPINIVPYQGVTQLLPNYYLNMQDLSITRYWPVENFEPLSVTIAAQKMASLLKSLTQAATHRRACMLNLTGGYDSRLILASAENMWPKCEFFTVKRTDSPSHDISIPKKLRHKFKLDHLFLSSCEDLPETAIANNALNQRLQRNVGGMRYDPSLQSTLAVKNQVGEKTLLLGLISEVNRCGYYHDGQHPSEITPKILSKLAGFEDNPIALKGCAQWLESLPDELPVSILDLFYWEYRLGVWASCGMSFSDAAFEQLSPMNCREYLQYGLATDVKYRQIPYILMRKTIGHLNPELLNFKFNYDLQDFTKGLLKGLYVHKMPIPWRVKKAIGVV